MTFKSTYKDVVAPPEYKDLLTLYIWHQLDLYADRTLLVDFKSGREWTGKEIKDEASRIARYLITELGLKPRDGCVFLSVNNDYVHISALAVILAGGFVCVGEPTDPQTEHDYMIKSIDTAIVFGDNRLYKGLVDIRNNLAGKHRHFKICILDDVTQKLPDDVTGLHNHIRQTTQVSGGKQVSLPVIVDPSDPVYILLTSGSTGRPKPVPRTQRNALYTCMACKNSPELWKLNESSVMAGHLPLDHGTGLYCTKVNLTMGVKLIVMRYYEQNTMLDAIERYGITDIMLGSAYLHNLIISEDVKKRDLSSLKNLLAVGSPLASHAVAVKFMDEHPSVNVRQVFGMTEFGFISMVPPEDARTDGKSVGLLGPNIKVRLLDISTGEEITELNKPGELYVTGPTLSPGYLGAHLADQTRAVFLPDGYYRSYDMAFFNEKNRLCMRGRINDVLCLCDGWKVLPNEIESLISEHPQVKEVAIIGIPHPDLPTCHAPRAFVVPREEGKLSESDVIQWVAERASEPKQLTGGVKLMDSLPRLTLAKVDRKALRAIQL